MQNAKCRMQNEDKKPDRHGCFSNHVNANVPHCLWGKLTLAPSPAMFIFMNTRRYIAFLGLTKSMIAEAKLETAIRTKFGSATSKPTVTLLPDEVQIAAATEDPADKKIHHIYGVDSSDAHWNCAMIKTKAGWKVSMAGTLEPFPLVPTKAWRKMFTASAPADSVTADVESGKLKSADEAKTAFQRLTEKAAKDSISPPTQKD